MTTALASERGRKTSEGIAARLWEVIDPAFLEVIAWDHDRKIVTFPQDHPRLGWSACAVLGCSKLSTLSSKICPTCTRRWKATGGQPLEEFIAVAKREWRAIGIGDCVVPDCQRPWTTSTAQLCHTHEAQRKRATQTLTEFLRTPGLTGFSAFDPCLVAACTRTRMGYKPAYCQTHLNRWNEARRADPTADELLWRRTTSAIAENNLVSLRGLPHQVLAEVLYGLQQRTHRDVVTKHHELRPFVDRVRRAQIGSLEELDPKLLSPCDRRLRTTMTTYVYLALATPESERHKDIWTAAVFGHSGTLRFTEISQPWLREATKRWAFDNLPRRRGDNGTMSVQFRINALAQLSTSLRLQRDDQGLHVSRLGRTDITAFTNRMGYLVDQGDLSPHARADQTRALRNVLTRMRTIGLKQPGEPLHGLPDEFSLVAEDMPDSPEDTEAGRDLPIEVMRHLCDHLALLERFGRRELRVAIELMIDTGRRPDEVAKLALDCLDRDGDGKPVLIYDNHKSGREGRRLPIPEATAALIVRQQEQVRARFPDTPSADLVLLPTPVANPHGHKSLGVEGIGDRHRDWVNTLPPVAVPAVVEENGVRVTKMLPFDKARIFPYAYRHTYAQRHADAGVDVTVLKELLDHRLISTTQRYYRVGEERRREAVERVTTMQFDRHGNRVWRQVKAMLDSEHARRAVGEVAVPYGGCSEPSNVAAGGQDCPIRFRCVGCGHFSTDISYLPDLERYLTDLLRHRERLAATLDADAWAKTEAMPSDEEIKRIRRLIDRMKGDLDELTEEERAQIEEAVAVVRRGRTRITSLGMPRVRQPSPDLRPERTA
jgi:integrase